MDHLSHIRKNKLFLIFICRLRCHIIITKKTIWIKWSTEIFFCYNKVNCKLPIGLTLKIFKGPSDVETIRSGLELRRRRRTYTMLQTDH